MANKEESAFLKGVESRLDSLFGEETKPVKENDLDASQAVTEQVVDDLKTDDFRDTQMIRAANDEAEISPGGPDRRDQPSFARDATVPIDGNMREIPPLDETGIPSETVKVQDKSAFISEIEKRFSAIFGDDENAGAVKETEDKAGPEEIKESEHSENISLPPSAVLQSHLKDLKSIVLSLEWEINNRILEQFEDEINKLYLFYTGDKVVQGLLRILRFAGRYIQVRGASSNQGSINLLMSVYDHLEGVMVSEGMTEANKRVFLIESIKQYQAWVESTDIESPEETGVPEAHTDEMKPLEMERSQFSSDEEQKEDVADVRVAGEKPLADAVIDQPAGDELSIRETAGEDQIESAFQEQDISLETKVPEIHVDEMKPLELERSEDLFNKTQKMKVPPFVDVQATEETPAAGGELTVRETAGEEQIESAFQEQDISSETQAPEIHIDEMKPLELERSEGNIPEGQKEEVADLQVVEEKLFTEAGSDQPAGDELSVRETAGEDQIAPVIKEQDSPVQAGPASIDEMPPAQNGDVERMIAAMKDLPPHEAFAWALDELKGTFQAEIDALKEEIRLLKNAG
ncbi:MAG: hypothetical protein CVU71_13010 [Deltaproteobacteria bacterium HGW-Deltaproteobacteria-6]|jgi:hypothetical protein|nr:MAG: hypothetical protein CVU71_13010 [Deltaproteobacteria bacterium HGW-Deltaproteobacteria-6]